jgi:DNA (cytosine-5)-methyltransferase 1
MLSLELFSGAGGLAKGLELAGFEHTAFIEFNKDACASLRQNFNADKVFETDIRKFCFSELPCVELVAGGPPCQPFSLGGKHGAYDDARDMFPYAIKAIHALKPKAFIFENVKGLMRTSFSDYFEYIILRLTYPDFELNSFADWREAHALLKKITPTSYSGVRYEVSYKLLNAADYGVPQTRERVVIVGILADLNIKWTFPLPTHSEERLFWEQYVSMEYWEQHNQRKPKQDHLAGAIKARADKLRNAYLLFPPSAKPWQTVRDALSEVPDPRDKHCIVDHLFKDGARSYPGHTGSEIDLPAKTIKAGGHGVPGGENMLRFKDDSIRYLTIYEAKLLQTFPEDFVITGAWGEAMRQIGNAVPVRMAQHLGHHLLSLISEQADDSENHLLNLKKIA